MKRVYCLYRVSDHGQVEKNDIPMQRIACRAYAEERDWQIVREFAEKGVSGYKLAMDQRDAILEIREEALAGKFDILLVYMFDRIGRRDDETPFVVEWLVRQGVAVWSVCEGEQRFDNHVDKLTNYIRYWQAAGESKKISERSRTRIRQLTAEGVFTGGCCPYGYELVRGERTNKKDQPMCELRINRSEAEVVRLIYEKAVREGYGSMRLASYLNDSGCRTRKGRRWGSSTIARILTNRLYIGYLHKGGVESPHLPELQIIDEELFTQAHTIRNNRGKGEEQTMSVPLQTKGKTLLSGFLYCAHCGARINGTMHQKRYVRKDGSVNRKNERLYRCNASVNGEPVCCDGPRTYRAERVDEAFKAAISALLGQLEALPAETIIEYKYQIALREQREKCEEARRLLEETRQDHQTLREEVARSIRGESSFGPSLLQSLLDETAQKIEARSAHVYEMEVKLQDTEQLRHEVEIKRLKYCGLKEIFEERSMEEKKMLLSVLVSRVELSRGYQLNIHLAPDFDRFLDGLIEMR